MSVHAQADHVIRAPIDTVWAVLTAIDQWPQWQSDVKDARCGQPLAPGVAFDWKAGGLAIHSTVEACTPPDELSWRGVALGSQAHHAWRLSPTEAGQTRVRVEERMEGWMVTLVKLFSRDFLQNGMDKQLKALAAESERRHAAA